MNLVRIVLALFLVSCFAGKALADAVIVPVDHYPPWKFTDQSKPISGIDIELTNRLLEAANLTAEYTAYPWKRCLLVMQNGEADLISGVTLRQERKAFLNYIQPPYKTKSTKAFYVLRGLESSIQSYKDLKSLQIGVVRGVKLFEQFDQDRSLNKTEVTQDDQNLHMLLAGRIDTFVATEATADHYIAQNGFGDRISKAKYSYDKPVNVYFALSKHSKLNARMDELSAIVQQMVNNGEVDRIINQYRKSNDLN